MSKYKNSQKYKKFLIKELTKTKNGVDYLIYLADMHRIRRAEIVYALTEKEN